jgi:hypothetical protein
VPDNSIQGIVFEHDARLKNAPYIWVTWLTKLIAGEAGCEWSLWFRARYRYEKLTAGTDLTRWTKEHDELVQDRAETLVFGSVKPTLEQYLTVRGKVVTVSGRPDIRYETEAGAVFEDCKTGLRRDSDHVQVLLYAWLYRLQTGFESAGRVIYPDEIVDVDMSRLGAIALDAKRLLDLCSIVVVPAQRPSSRECRSCNIGPAYCRSRDLDQDSVFVTTEF